MSHVAATTGYGYSMIEQRLSRLWQHLPDDQLQALLVNNDSNVRYLSGYRGSESCLLVDRNQLRILLTDFRYIEQAKREAPGYTVICCGGSQLPLSQMLRQLSEKYAIKHLGFEDEQWSVADFNKLQTEVEDLRWQPLGNLIMQVRAKKDQQEIVLLQQAAKATDRVFAAIAEKIKPGLSEKDITKELAYLIADQGCESSFPIIVASGINGALPHAQPQADKLVQKGDLITLDFGCAYDGYRADTTRTLILGQPTAKQRQIYDIVLEAHRLAASALRSGIEACQIDALARDYITEAGFGENFGHGLGHGIGLDVHELPLLNRISQQILEEDMVTTIEPGIYIPGWGGIRIENDYLLTAAGCQRLLDSSQELICL